MGGKLTRRRFLVAAPALSLVPGCNSTGEPAGEERSLSETPAQSPTSSPQTPSTWRVNAISAAASVVSQPTVDHPLEVELSITNEHDVDVRLVPTDRSNMLEYMPPMNGTSVNVIMVPSSNNYSVIPDAQINGCWRLNAESPEEARAKIHFVPEPLPTVLEPNETYSIRHEVYHNGSSDICFPDEEYETTKSLFFSKKIEHDVYRYDEQLAFDLQYRLTIADDGGVSIAVNGPIKKR